MNTFVACALLLLSSSFAITAEPSVQLRLGTPERVKAPKGSATAGSTWVTFPVHVDNLTTHSIWLHGHGLNSPFYQLFTRRTDSETWLTRGMGFCGTGAKRHQLRAGATTTFSVSVPVRYVGQQLRVELRAYQSADDATPDTINSEGVPIK
jgi:hypothetical protein